MACAACHADPHLGQVGGACDRCHAVDAAKFAPARFSHGATAFALEGRHASTACARCHARETATYPAGPGTAARLRPMPADCRSCHRDPHLGQTDRPCSACHTPTTFAVTGYPHAGLERVFGVGNHNQLACRACHKVETGQFPAGRGTAVRLKPPRGCIECHP